MAISKGSYFVFSVDQESGRSPTISLAASSYNYFVTQVDNTCNLYILNTMTDTIIVLAIMAVLAALAVYLTQDNDL
jgi:hypothetical protein